MMAALACLCGDPVGCEEGEQETSMPRTKKQPPAPTPEPTPSVGNGFIGEVLTLSEAAAYLRLPEQQVVSLVHSQDLPGRFTGREWRFLKSAIQEWLSQPPPKYSKEAQLSVAGLLKDDPDLVPMVEEIYRKRGRPITEDGSYNLLHRLVPGSGKN
jgi:excisionase family DNA binding protein